MTAVPGADDPPLKVDVSAIRLRCQCGALQGRLVRPMHVNRAVCYCHDCQAFAHVLGQAANVLDERGGSDIIQTRPADVTFTQGAEHLACLRLTPKGTMRWYAGCCSTLIGNTAWTAKISFVGLIHTFLDAEGAPLSQAVGPITTWINTAGARGDPKPQPQGVGRTMFWLTRTILSARLSGSYRQTPFFDPGTDAPVVTPRVLEPAEHARVMAAVRQG